MKVACNLMWLVPGMVGGTETATVATLRQVAAEPPDDIELTLFALDVLGQTYPDLIRAFPSHLAPLTGRLRPLRVAAENSWLARQTHGRFDLVHHMGGVLPVVRGTPGLVTIHDLQPFDMPANFQPAKRIYLQRSIPRSTRQAAGVIAPSEFVRRGLIDRFGVSPEHVRTVWWGVDPPSTDVSVAQVQARYGLPRRWFVYPSFTWNHKNHGLLLQAFASVAAREHDVMLVLTGGEGPAEQVVVDQITQMGLRGRVRRTGLIPRRDVLAIVRGAVALTFPSRYEGFGLPVLEAMSVGTPVLASDAGALPEVVGDGGRLVPVDDAEAWSTAMSRMLEDGEDRQRLADAGRRRVTGFTWRRTAAGILDAYRAVGTVGASAVEPAPAGAGADPDVADDPGDVEVAAAEVVGEPPGAGAARDIADDPGDADPAPDAEAAASTVDPEDPRNDGVAP